MTPRPLINDLTGQRFGRLTVSGRAPNRNGRVMWDCVCDCGGTTVVESSNLIFTQMSCGCYRDERLSEIRSRRDGVGTRYGRLVVESYDGPFAEVVCDCGVRKRVRNKHLRDGSTRSCGCLRRSRSRMPSSPPPIRDDCASGGADPD